MVKMVQKYETHMHTSESSACARSTGREMAQAAKEAGYTGIIITDHNWYGNSCISAGLPWEEWIEQFCTGYEHAKDKGEEIGLDVFFGYESCYQGTEFLIYGVDKMWLKLHPEIKDASIKEQHELIRKAEGMVIHAHPYREEWYIPKIRLFPEDVDGVEGINATHSGVEGPLRSGIFAAVDDDQQAAGATHWGVMEMSGNVRELCRNVNDWYFYWNRHGDGIYNPGLWSTNLLYYGVRGGGFTSSVEEICVSDRSVREYFSLHSVSYRDSTVGFRAVRTFELGAIDLNPGSISALAQVCPNVEVTIESKDSAFVT